MFTSYGEISPNIFKTPLTRVNTVSDNSTSIRKQKLSHAFLWTQHSTSNLCISDILVRNIENRRQLWLISCTKNGAPKLSLFSTLALSYLVFPSGLIQIYYITFISTKINLYCYPRLEHNALFWTFFFVYRKFCSI